MIFLFKQYISFGIDHEADMVEDQSVWFKNNTIVGFEEFNHLNLFACRYLSLRNSLFAVIQPDLLP